MATLKTKTFDVLLQVQALATGVWVFNTDPFFRNHYFFMNVVYVRKKPIPNILPIRENLV